MGETRKGHFPKTTNTATHKNAVGAQFDFGDQKEKAKKKNTPVSGIVAL